MSGFSNYLNGYMEESSITSAELSKEINIDRTTIFRYRKGTRIPADEETVAHLAEGLRMSIPERKKLFEEYDRLTIGEFTVNSYFYVKELMKNLKTRIESPIPAMLPSKGALREKALKNIIGLRSKNDLLAYLGAVFEYVKEEGEEVFLVMQPQYEEIQKLLQAVFCGSEIRIEQIICLEQSLPKCYRNLEIFQYVLLLFYEHLNVHVQYYYDFLSHHINSMSRMPNMVIAGKYVLEFDFEMNSGTLIQDADYVNIMKAEYLKLKQNTVPFFLNAASQMNVKTFYNDLTFTMEISLNYDPCVGLEISSDIYENYLYPFPGKEEFINEKIRALWDWDDMEFKPHVGFEKPRSICKKDGIRNFMETGRAREFPEEFYEALPMDVRKKILKRMILLIQNQKIEYFFLPEDFPLLEDIFFYWNFSKNNLIINHVMENRVAYIHVNEPGICRTFQGFFEYLERKNMLTPQEEVIQAIEEILKEYE